MSAPLVSVVVGSYNKKPYVRESLDSALAQTFADREIIVVDDVSTDGTIGILREYGDRIRLAVRERNSGVCGVTRNDGFRMAAGRYVAFLDADDAWYPGKLEAQVRFMEANPDIPLCHSYVHVMDEQSKILRVRHEGALPPTGNCYRRLLRHCFISTSSVMIRRELFDRVGGFPDDPVYGSAGEEYYFFLRVARDYPIGLVDGVLARYRLSSQGSMADANGWKWIPEVVPLYERVIRDPSLWKGAVLRTEVVDTILDACLENAVYWREKGRKDRSVYFALRALRWRPSSPAAWKELAKAALKHAGRLAGQA